MRTTGKPRASGEPAEATARKIAIAIDLIRNGRVSIGALQQRYGYAERSVLRDLQELRRIGQRLGFTIGPRDAAGTVRLVDFEKMPRDLMLGKRDAAALLGEIFKAFGRPLSAFADGLETASDSFVQVVMPELVEGSRIEETFAFLREAWRDHARVRFRYKGREREVEPYRTMVRSGRYYLIGRQVSARSDEWRVYSLDEVRGPLARCGTFVPKDVPAEYASRDAIGWIRTGAKHHVEVTVSARLAQTAVSRRWQSRQIVVQNEDGTATLHFEVGDVDEAIRWALGFGDEAWISAPASAVRRAREVVKAIATRYARRREA